MDLDDTINWESDPELKAIFEQFIATFYERRARLVHVIKGFASGVDSVELRKCLRFEAHKIGGAASTYGFPTLTTVGLEIDEFLTRPNRIGLEVSVPELESLARLLDELLAVAEETRKDPGAFLVDPRRRILGGGED